MQTGKKSLTGNLRSRGIYLGLAGVRVAMVLMVTGLLFSERVQADSVCNTLEECRVLFASVQTRIRELDPQPKTKTTITGAIFERVDDHPEFGEPGRVWKDPSGLIWGDVVKDSKGSILSMAQREAVGYCWDLRGKLPSGVQFEQLAKYLGKGEGTEYIPQALPNLARSWFWSSLVDPNNSYNAFVFHGDRGFFSIIGRTNGSGAVRCVL